MSETEFQPIDGGCACGQLRYRLKAAPMFVHCCHCTWCQRETGSAFAVNALVETANVEVLDGATETVNVPSASGKGQQIVFCPDCRTALWSHYAGAGEVLSFVRAGTLDQPSGIHPDVHIFTSTKQPWVMLPEDTPVFEEYYSAKALWPPTSQARFKALKS
jgi:hypothetical protein